MAEHRHHVHGQAVGAVAQFVEALGALAEAVAAVHRLDSKVQQQCLAASADSLGDRFQGEAGQFQPQGRRAQFDPPRLHRECRALRFPSRGDRTAFPPFRQHRVRMLARVGDGGILKPQPQATREQFGALNPQPDARPGQFDPVARDGQRIGGVEIERMDFLAEEHGQLPAQRLNTDLGAIFSASICASWVGGT